MQRLVAGGLRPHYAARCTLAWASQSQGIAGSLSQAASTSPSFLAAAATFSSSSDANPGSSSRHLILGSLGLATLGFGLTFSQTAQAKQETKPAAKTPAAAPATASSTKELPTYTADEVAKHRTPQDRVWVTYKGHVYDITEFIEAHPGGVAKIMMAAGGSIEPFWALYQQHAAPSVQEILAEYKIGKLAGGSAATQGAFQDPWANEPPRHPALLVRAAKPFNSETPLGILSDSLITPTDIFYIRNHLPVPEVDPKSYRLTVEGEGLKTVELSLDELKSKFKKHHITATVQCAGNRRHDMMGVKPVKGLDWTGGAIATATWGGVKLRDVLQYAGLSEDDPEVQHIHFVGLDRDPLTGEQYAVSIPAAKALSSMGDCLLAWEMNGQELTRDHGYPLRVVVPGFAGARCVKWLGRIHASASESQSHWQQKDYKSFPPGVDWDTVDWSSAPAIMEAPITSLICEPAEGTTISAEDGEVKIKGYAWSGGGREVIRVDLSLDGGKTWQASQLKKVQQKFGRAWAWSLYEATLPLPKGYKGPMQLVCKAVDNSYNQQPDSVEAIWNLRGVVNNAWHRVNIVVA